MMIAEKQDMGNHFVICDARNGSILVPGRKFDTRETARQAWTSESWEQRYADGYGIRFEIETNDWRKANRGRHA